MKIRARQICSVAALVGIGVGVLFVPRWMIPRQAGIDHSGTGVPSGNYPMRFADGVGRTVTIARRPERLIALAPSLTETVFFLGAGERLFGRSRYDLWPAKAEKVPVVGGVNDPQLEQILSLKPDLILVTKLTPREVVHQFEQLRLNTVVFQHEGIDGTLRDMQTLSTILDAPESGKKRLAALSAQKKALEARFADVPKEARPRTLLLFGVNGFYSAGPGSFAGEMIELAGGRNVADAATVPWPQVSMESILDWDPRVILISEDKGPEVNESIKQTIAAWERDSRWKDVSAIRDHRVHIMNDSVMAVPGPRMIDTAERIAALLFPDAPPATQP